MSRILLSVDDPQVLALLTAQLAERHQLCGPGTVPDWPRCDLALVDFAALQRRCAPAWPAPTDPGFGFTPVVLVAAAPELAALPPAWQSLIDDVLRLPLEAAETHFRVESLLMTQRLCSRVRRLEAERRHEEALHRAETLAAVARLAGGAAHDFNNILTVIAGYSQLLLKDQADEERCRQPLGHIREGIRRAVELTRQLLAFSRQTAVESTQLDLNSLITELELVLARLPGAEIELVPRLHGAPVPVCCRREPLEELLINLVIHAKDALGWTGRLRVESALAPVSGAAAARLSMADGLYGVLGVWADADPAAGAAGASIRPDDPTAELEPLTATACPELGLLIDLAARSGGLLTRDGSATETTGFRLWFPSAAPAWDMAPTAPLFGWETVLVVEPHDAVRALAVIVLRTHGYRVLEGRTVAEAQDVLEQHQGAVDLLLVGLSQAGPAAELAAGLVRGGPRFKVLDWSAAAEAVPPLARTASGVACFGPLSLARKIRDVLSEPVGRNLPSQRQIG